MIGAMRKMYSKSPYGLHTISDTCTTPALATTNSGSRQPGPPAATVLSTMRGSLCRITVKFHDAWCKYGFPLLILPTGTTAEQLRGELPFSAFGVLRYARSAAGGRFRIYSCPRRRASGFGQYRGPLLTAGPSAARSDGHGPIRHELVPAESPFRTPRTRLKGQPWRDQPGSSGPALPLATQSRRPDAPVPGGSPAGP